MTGALAALAIFGCGQPLAPPPLAAQEIAPVPERDSSFLLTSNDPARSPSGFIGNGHLGVVIPPLGLGGSVSLLAGLYEHGPGDVPRIAALPTWNAISVFDGERWLEASPRQTAASGYRQALDMRTGTARTTYEWVDGNRRTGVKVETLVSRAEPHLAAMRLELTPRYGGRVGVRFAMAERPPPAASRWPG